MEPCSQCQSTNFCQDSNGFMVCENGHQSQSYWEEQPDELVEENILRGSRKITGVRKKARVKKEEPAPSVIKLGDVVGFTVLEICQTILRSQVQAIIGLAGPNDGFEDCVKKVWLLYVSATKVYYDEEDIHKDAPSAERAKQQEEFVVASLRALNTRLLTNLAILYIASLQCEMGIFPGEIHRWCTEGKLPYFLCDATDPERIIPSRTLGSIIKPPANPTGQAINHVAAGLSQLLQGKIPRTFPTKSLAKKLFKELVVDDRNAEELFDKFLQIVRFKFVFGGFQYPSVILAQYFSFFVQLYCLPQKNRYDPSVDSADFFEWKNLDYYLDFCQKCIIFPKSDLQKMFEFEPKLKKTFPKPAKLSSSYCYLSIGRFDDLALFVGCPVEKLVELDTDAFYYRMRMYFLRTR